MCNWLFRGLNQICFTFTLFQIGSAGKANVTFSQNLSVLLTYPRSVLWDKNLFLLSFRRLNSSYFCGKNQFGGEGRWKECCKTAEFLLLLLLHSNVSAKALVTLPAQELLCILAFCVWKRPLRQISGDLEAYSNCSLKKLLGNTSKILKLRFCKTALFYIPVHSWRKSFSTSEHKNYVIWFVF